MRIPAPPCLHPREPAFTISTSEVLVIPLVVPGCLKVVQRIFVPDRISGIFRFRYGLTMPEHAPSHIVIKSEERHTFSAFIAM
jgi:hypothetical protein